MKPILISGAFGFVGTNLSAHLHAAGFRLWALDTASATDAARHHPYERLFTWERLAELPLGEIGALIHLAGKAHDTRHSSDPAAYFTINAALTRTLIERLSALPAAADISFILFSTVKAVADSVSGILSEDVLPAPQTPYGQSKLEAESIVMASPLRSYILRPCMIYGPGNKGNLNLLYRFARLGLPWPLAAFESRHTFAAIANVCAVVERLLAGTVAPAIYQVADDESFSTNELIELMAVSLRRRARLWHLPPTLIRRAALLGDRLHLPLTSERLQKLTSSYMVSNAKIKSALGWQKMPYAARPAMLQTLEGFAPV